MPEIGERKTVNGVTGEWDGEDWIRVSTPTAASDAAPITGGALLPAAMRAASSLGGPAISAGGELVAQFAEMATGRRTPSLDPGQAFGLSPVQIATAAATGMIPGVKAIKGLKMMSRGAIQGGATAALQEAASGYSRGDAPQAIAAEAGKAGAMGAVTGAVMPSVIQRLSDTAAHVPDALAAMAPGLSGRLLRLLRRLPPEMPTPINPVPTPINPVLDLSQRRGMDIVQRAQQEILSPDQYAAGVARLRALGVPETMVNYYLSNPAAAQGLINAGGVGRVPRP